MVSCARINAKAWAGLITFSGSASAAFWPTIWAWVRQFRYWHFSNGGGPTDRPKGPSLAIVPRSLVFNWMQEAAKFTPRLRVLDYTGPGRHSLRESFADYDLIITTYGTVRTDIAELTNFQFDYAILDEAQAIKNAESQSAKAARLLRSRYKLAISGTPIENHLGELWSIFEFLNPGMLGTDSVFKKYVGSGTSLEQMDRVLLAKALRPFILRRTKQQVVEDLPEKTEQTLYCDMEAEQRRCYDELRAHYRDALLRKDAAELNRSKIEVLEALLRLRQAACHPGLISPELASDRAPNSKCSSPRFPKSLTKVIRFSSFLSLPASWRLSANASSRKRSSMNISMARPATALPRSNDSRPIRLSGISDQPEGRWPGT